MASTVKTSGNYTKNRLDQPNRPLQVPQSVCKKKKKCSVGFQTQWIRLMYGRFTGGSSVVTNGLVYLKFGQKRSGLSRVYCNLIVISTHVKPCLLLFANKLYTFLLDYSFFLSILYSSCHFVFLQLLYLLVYKMHFHFRCTLILHGGFERKTFNGILKKRWFHHRFIQGY